MNKLMMAVVTFLAVGLQAREIKSTDITKQNTSYDVAQIADRLNIPSDVTAQVVVVYRGGIVAPFGALLTVWDPYPRDGSDFGTLKTFDLGTYADVGPITNVRLLTDATAQLQRLIFDISLNVPNEELDGSVKKKFRIEVGFISGQVFDAVDMSEIP